MNKDAWVMIMVIVASVVLMLVVGGCSLVNVQVAQGSPAEVNKVFDPGAIDINRKDAK